ncbi:MAG: EF-P lysine aminoacylase EpmA [bacterium]
MTRIATKKSKLQYNRYNDPILKNILIRHNVYRQIRIFFAQRDYVEVETPVLVPCPGVDPHIDAISVEGKMYLATSPELQMKRLLGMGMKRIFQFTKAFRKGEQGELHNPEFNILEWYHTEKDYYYLMDEIETLVRDLVEVVRDSGEDNLKLGSDPFPRYEVDELFEAYAGWVPSLCWDENRFFLDFIEKIEPHICSIPAIIIYNFPAPVASLARLKSDNSYQAERFELYLNGLEIANAFSELTDPQENRKRFQDSQERRREMGKDIHSLDQRFIQALEKESLPPCAGIALGLDRLIMALTGERSIEEVMSFPVSRL